MSQWDAIIIGAGPAGAVSALQLARQGWRVLLLERAAWPREKVCGGCVNAHAIAMLASINVDLPRAHPIDRCVVHSAERSVDFDIPQGTAIDRRTLDALLVDHSVRAGATFIDRATAIVLDIDGTRRQVRLTREDRSSTLHASWLLVCDGINGRSLAHHPWAGWNIATDSHIGVATCIPGDAMNLSAGQIHMHVGDHGYVGRVRLADGTIHLAAALDPKAGSPARHAADILRDCCDVDLENVRWHGTGQLTRHRARLGAERVLVVGDSCGYVEPFTGQGIAWAIESAMHATSMLIDANPGTASLTEPWERLHRRTVGRHQRACRAVRYSLRRPAVRNFAMHALQAWPQMPRWITSPIGISA